MTATAPARGLEIESTRLNAEIEQLAQFSETQAPSITRVLYTTPDMQARAWLKSLYAEAGLEVREDAVGNTFARWRGTDPSAAPVATGSHIDAIPNSGKYDGVVGVLGALEAIRALQRTGRRPRRSIELVMFTAEEPTRFGLGCLGSRIMAGTIERWQLERLRDKEGFTVAAASTQAGFSGAAESARLAKDCYHAFIELHIEQGPLLERDKIPIGVVTAIAAPATLRVEMTGEGGHAGTVLMPDRHDPSLPAAEIMLAVERAALATGSRDTVATCGLVQVSPGAVNSIPRHVRLEIDVRDIDKVRRDAVLATIHDYAMHAASRRGCGYSEQLINADPPAICAPHIIAAVEQAATGLALPCTRMISRAYHDSLFMAQVCPTAMVFVPSKDGISHRPDEYTSPEEIAQGVRVLAGALERLAG